VDHFGETAFSGLWQPAAGNEFERLGVSLDADGCTGFDVRTFPASTWLIHAMYEVEMESPGSHDEREKQEIADGVRMPLVINGVDTSARTTSTGTETGWTKAPGEPYGRVRWRDYAARVGLSILQEGQWPSFRGFQGSISGGGSWPENVEPPAEGSIDEESWRELVRVLVGHSSLGAGTRCLAFYTPWAMHPSGSPYLLDGSLGNAAALIDNPSAFGSPQNFWPESQEWFVYTDYDLQASRISGSPELIAELLANDDLDCENLPGVAA
jgi:hypothetical protein